MNKSMVIEGWRDEGRQEGQVTAHRNLLMLLVNTRLGTDLPEEARRAVEEETDLARLSEWVKTAGTANTAEQIRDAILGHVGNGA